jgi:hypothetical protein
MRNPEYNDPIAPRSKADDAITRASLNNARLANKKGSAKKAVAKKPVAKKAVAPKPTDSRFMGLGAGKPKPRSGANSMQYTPGSTKGSKSKTDSRFTGVGAGKPKPSGSMSYTAGSTKNNKATYTTGSGVNSKASKTRPRFGGFSMLADSLTKKNPKAPKAVTARRTSGSK